MPNLSNPLLGNPHFYQETGGRMYLWECDGNLHLGNLLPALG
jgi:hypothetical protein